MATRSKQETTEDYATVVINDAQLAVRIAGDERDAAGREQRPFEVLDTESLLVLYHALRAEVASR